MNLAMSPGTWPRPSVLVRRMPRSPPMIDRTLSVRFEMQLPQAMHWPSAQRLGAPPPPAPAEAKPRGEAPPDATSKDGFAVSTWTIAWTSDSWSLLADAMVELFLLDGMGRPASSASIIATL